MPPLQWMPSHDCTSTLMRIVTSAHEMVHYHSGKVTIDARIASRMQSIPQTNTTNTSALGSLLRQWRRRRNVSQMELALEAKTSTRHLSFIETGRALPSPGILEALLAVLNVPLHEANIFRHLARFGPECPLGIGDEVLPEEGW